MLHGDVVDQLLNNDGLADTGAAEQADFSAAQIGFDQVDHLDACLEHFELGRLFLERRRGPVNRVELLGLDGAHLIHRLADHVHHAAQGFISHGHHNRVAQAFRGHAAHQAFSGFQRDRAHASLAQVLLCFANDVDRLRNSVAFTRDADRGVNLRDLPLWKFAVHRRSGHLHYFTDYCFSC